MLYHISRRNLLFHFSTCCFYSLSIQKIADIVVGSCCRVELCAWLYDSLPEAANRSTKASANTLFIAKPSSLSSERWLVLCIIYQLWKVSDVGSPGVDQQFLNPLHKVWRSGTEMKSVCNYKGFLGLCHGKIEFRVLQLLPFIE